MFDELGVFFFTLHVNDTSSGKNQLKQLYECCVVTAP